MAKKKKTDAEIYDDGTARHIRLFDNPPKNPQIRRQIELDDEEAEDYMADPFGFHEERGDI